MTYLLDTCALSELRKEIPVNVKNWFNDKNQQLFYISVINIAEIRYGIERLPDSKKKNDLENWFYSEVRARFADNILTIDEPVAETWASLNATSQKKGITVGTQDLYIAACAKANGFILVTINTKDFQHLDIPLINPWSLL